MSFSDLLRLLFGFRATVGRKQYAVAGFSLLALKYAGDWALTQAAAEHAVTPAFYLNPIFSMRLRSLGRHPEWLEIAMLLWAAPFVWIGLSMTARRAADAGHSVLAGLAFFVPVVNNLVMLMLCVAAPYGLPQHNTARVRAATPGIRAALLGIGAAAVVGLLGTLAAVNGAGRYDSSVFLALPFLIGFVAGLAYNRKERRGIGATLGVAALSITAAGGLLLLFALEGIICLAMAAVLAYPLALFGALIGRGMSKGAPAFPPAATMLVAWPVFALVPPWQSEQPPVREVISSVEIAAPPEVVWHHVIGFSELPPPDGWVLRTGIAYPLRARIEGEGVGAIRRCEFTTGAFVEPITRWEPARRLSFDVASQPPSMKEWSPYEIVHAPHVIGSMRSLRGEFRLTPLPGGRTRLEGSTWYRLTLAPSAYWSWFADRIVQAIHDRVLRHVSAESAAQARALEMAGNP